MKAIILAMLMTTSAYASDYYDLRDYNPDPKDAWQYTTDQKWDSSIYYIDENGYTQAYREPDGYIYWTDIDEDVIDYEVRIKIK